MKDVFKGIAKTGKHGKHREHQGGYREQSAETMRKRRAAERDLPEMPDPEDVDRMESCRYDLKLFLETYLTDRFDKEWSKPQLRCIDKLQYAILNGGLFALAMPRGSGKTAICIGGAIWAMLYAHKHYVVMVGATSTKAEQLLKDIKTTLRFGQLILEDFPSVAIPIRDIQGNALRAKAQTYLGEPTAMEWSTARLVLADIPGCSSSGSMVEVFGITGDIRGAHITLPSGKIRRPDFAICDDPQTKVTARSLSQCNFREEVIRGDVLGLAGPGEKISCAVPCTIIEEGDLAARLTDNDKNPDFQGEISSAVMEWPKHLESKDKEETIWELYNAERIRGLKARDKGEAANAFYEKHRKKLEKGAEVAWNGRQEEGDITALQSLMNKYFQLGKKAFYAEYQNCPLRREATVYDLTVEQVAGNINGYERFTIPDDAIYTVAMVDINYIGLNYAVIAFEANFTGYIIDYGKMPEHSQEWLVPPKSDEVTVSRNIQAGLTSLMEVFQHKRYHRGNEREQVNVVLIDANFRTEVVMKVIRQLKQMTSLKIVADRGRQDKRYKLPARGLVHKKGAKWHYEKGPQGFQIVHSADYWRMHAQKALTLPAAITGSLTLWGSDPDQHMDFAAEIVSERLATHVPGTFYDVYDWVRNMNVPNDKLDAVVGCYPAAAYLGAELIEAAGPSPVVFEVWN